MPEETATTLTMPQWLYWRFGDGDPLDAVQSWDDLPADQRAYWYHEAAAVQRAVMRGGFKDTQANGDN
jgi:hypothetical protein